MRPLRRGHVTAVAALARLLCVAPLLRRAGGDCAVSGVVYRPGVITAGCRPANCTDAGGQEVTVVDTCTAPNGANVAATDEADCLFTDFLWDATAEPPGCTTADGTAPIPAADEAECTLTGNAWVSAQLLCLEVPGRTWRPADIILSSSGALRPTRCEMSCPPHHVRSGTQPGCLGRLFDPKTEDPVTCTPVATCGDKDGVGPSTDPVTDEDCGVGWYYSEDANHKCVGVDFNPLHLADLNGCCNECELVPRAAEGASYTCTSATDSRVSGCATGFYKQEGSEGYADNCTSCRPIPYHAADGEVDCDDYDSSWVVPPTPYSSMCAHGYYRKSQVGTTDGMVCHPFCSGWGELVAGGGDDGSVGRGSEEDRFDGPTFFTLHEHNGTTTLHVSDTGNDRVVKWIVGQVQGTTVVPRREDADHIRTSLGTPSGVAIANGFVFVAEERRHRVLKWKGGAGWCRITNTYTKCAGGLGMVNQRQTRSACEEAAVEISAISYSYIQEEDQGYARFESDEFCGVTHPDTGETACIRDLLPNCQIVREHCVDTEQGSQAMDWRMYGQCGLPVAGKEFDPVSAHLDFCVAITVHTVQGRSTMYCTRHSCGLCVIRRTSAQDNERLSYESGDLDEAATPSGVFVTDDEVAYVSDVLNDRIVRWRPGDPQIRLVSELQGTGSTIVVDASSSPHARALFGAGVQTAGECPNADCPDGRDRAFGTSGTYTGARFVAHDFSSTSETLRLRIDGRNDMVEIVLTSYMHSVTASVDALNLLQEAKRAVCYGLRSSPSGCENEPGCSWDADRSIERCDVMWRAEVSTTGEKVAGGEKCRSNADCTGLGMLDDPQGLIVQGTNLYIVDSGNHRVVEWPIGSNSAARVVAGTSGVSGIGLNELNTPTGIGIDWTGALYVADTNNNRVMRYTLGSTTGTLVAGSLMGQPGSGLNSLMAPTDVKVDYAGNVYISDTGNHRIVRWCAPGVTDQKCEVPAETGGQTAKAWPNGVRLPEDSPLHCAHPFGGAFDDVCDLGCLPDWTPSGISRGRCVHVGRSARNHFVGHQITCTPPGSGCLDPLAANFDPEATVDDGSCILPAPFPWWAIVLGVFLVGGGVGAWKYRQRRQRVSVATTGENEGEAPAMTEATEARTKGEGAEKDENSGSTVAGGAITAERDP